MNSSGLSGKIVCICERVLPVKTRLFFWIPILCTKATLAKATPKANVMPAMWAMYTFPISDPVSVVLLNSGALPFFLIAERTLF